MLNSYFCQWIIFLFTSDFCKCYRCYSHGWVIRDKCASAKHARATNSLRREEREEKRDKPSRKRNVSLTVRSILPSSITRPRVYLVICRETRDSRKASHADATVQSIFVLRIRRALATVHHHRSNDYRGLATRGVKEKTEHFCQRETERERESVRSTVRIRQRARSKQEYTLFLGSDFPNDVMYTDVKFHSGAHIGR